MADRFLLKIAAPMVAISLLLVALGAVAAWNVHRQQVITSTLIAREVEGMLAAHDLYVGMRDIRRKLTDFVRTGDRHSFDTIPELHESTRARLETAKSLARTEQEQSRIEVVDRGYHRFWEEFGRINQRDLDTERAQTLAAILEQSITEEILEPGQQYIDVSRQVVERTNQASRVTSEQMRQGFLLLGVCGGAGGLIAGLGLARAVSRSIVQLEVSVHSAAGRLHSIVGPVRISRVGGYRELETGLTRIEAHIADLVERLQQSELEVLRNEQLAAVGQLAAGIAHELRNPLMPMKMLVQSALERDDDRGLCGRPLEVVEEEIERLEHSIEAFLEFARPAPPQKSQFDLVPIVEQALELAAARARKQNVQIREQLPESPIMVIADAGQIRQVLLNLLLNALDALPEGGEIAVDVGQITGREAASSADRQLWCEVHISDTGTGIDPGLLERIFEPFVTTKETGTGLGLSICRRIILDHGGEITATNDLHGGAQFHIRLPTLAHAAIALPQEVLSQSS